MVYDSKCHVNMFYSCSGAVGRCVRCLNPASNVGVFSLDDATAPRHVSHYEKLDRMAHICVSASKNGITAVNTGDVMST